MARPLLPRAGWGKQGALGLTAVLLAGCGGSSKPDAPHHVSGNGYAFSAPAAWKVVRSPRVVQAMPSQGPEIVSVSVFPLQHPYRPELRARVVPELDRVAADVATQLGGSRSVGRTQTLAGLPGRTYEVRFGRSGRKLVERISFVLRDKSEYQLLCRWDSNDARTGKSACDTLESSFRLN